MIDYQATGVVLGLGTPALAEANRAIAAARRATPGEYLGLYRGYIRVFRFADCIPEVRSLPAYPSWTEMARNLAASAAGYEWGWIRR